jgi:hypothetical protein
MAAEQTPSKHGDRYAAPWAIMAPQPGLGLGRSQKAQTPPGRQHNLINEYWNAAWINTRNRSSAR